MARKRGQGEGSIFQRKDLIWVAAISTPEGRKVRYAKTRQLAAQKLQEMQQAAAGGLPEARRDITVEQLMAEYLAERQSGWSIQTYRSAEQHVRLHIVPHLGSMKLSALDARAVAAWLRKMPQARHAQLARDHLMSACDLAMRWDWIPRNPVKLTNAVKRKRKPPPEISRQQLRDILEATKSIRSYAAVCLMLGCGLRASETLGLTWSDWDESAGTMKIERQLLNVPRLAPSLVPLKTKSSRGVCSVPSFAADALRAHREAQKTEKAVRGAKGLAWENEWDLIFTGLRGQPMRQQALSDTMGNALREVGISGVTPHTLRHAFASILIDELVPITEVAAALRHAGPAVTMQVYAHKIQGKPSRTAGIMDGLVEGGH